MEEATSTTSASSSGDRGRELRSVPKITSYRVTVEGECIGCLPESRIFESTSLSAISDGTSFSSECDCPAGLALRGPTSGEFVDALDREISRLKQDENKLTVVKAVDDAFDVIPVSCGRSNEVNEL